MVTNPEISVITPVYNAEKYLDDCISSIVKQSFQNFELLLLPGSSSDSSTQICQRWAQIDQRIRIIEQDRNSCAYARNKAIAHSNAKYICFCDADDLYTEDYLQKMYVAITNSDADMVECMFYITSDDLSSKTIYDFLKIKDLYGLDMLDRRHSPAIWKYITKKEIWEKNELTFPETKTASDMAIYSLLRSCCKNIDYLYEPLYIYRLVDSSLTHAKEDPVNKLKTASAICEFITSEFRKRNIFEEKKYSLISQAEHHLGYMAASFEDSSADISDCCSKLSNIIKNNYGINHTLFDYSILGWGTDYISSLCTELRKNPQKDLNYIENMSFSDLADTNIKKEFEDLCKRTSHDLIVIDMSREVAYIQTSKNNISPYIKRWAIGASIFNATIAINPSKTQLFLLEKYTEDTAIDSILKMLYENFLQLCPNCTLIPHALVNADHFSEYEYAYFYEKIVDIIHQI